MRIRSGRGLGDGIYLRAIVDHLVSRGERVVALSDYPDLFAGSGATVEPFTRAGNPRIAHYVDSMADQSVGQWAAMLRRAGLPSGVPLRIRWQARDTPLLARVREAAAGRPIILVHAGRTPMQRDDGFGAELVPSRESTQCALAALSDCYRVRIGGEPNLYSLAVDEDLTMRTAVADLIDLASICVGVVAQCSFAVPLAEALDRPLLALWGAGARRARHPHVRHITPRKVLTNPTSVGVYDDAPAAEIASAARSLLCPRAS